MSRLRADEVLNKAATGPFLATEGINIPEGKNIFFNSLIETTVLDGTSLTTTDVTANNLIVSGNSTITGTLSFVTDGTTSIDDTSITTTDITSSTLTVDQVNLGDNDRLRFGDGIDFQIYHNGSNGTFLYAAGSINDLYIDCNATSYYRSDSQNFTNVDGTKTLATLSVDDSVELYFSNSKKIETTNTGVAITGVTTSTDGWAGTTSSANVLGGLAMPFTCGMNGRIQLPSINATMLFGGSEYNGDNSEGVTMPHAGKLYSATIFAERVTGSADIQAQINGTRNSSYKFNISASNQTNVSQIQTWYETPLSFNAGDRINFSFETTSITYLEVLTICFFVKFD